MKINANHLKSFISMCQGFHSYVKQPEGVLYDMYSMCYLLYVYIYVYMEIVIIYMHHMT